MLAVYLLLVLPSTDCIFVAQVLTGYCDDIVYLISRGTRICFGLKRTNKKSFGALLNVTIGETALDVHIWTIPRSRGLFSQDPS